MSQAQQSSSSFFIENILKSSAHQRKQRKARTAFTDHQIKELEESFQQKKYLSVQDRLDLAKKLNLNDVQVKTWYQNRRTKQKRQTAVGVELLRDSTYLQACQSFLQQNNYQWLLNHVTGNPNAQIETFVNILGGVNNNFQQQFNTQSLLLQLQQQQSLQEDASKSGQQKQPHHQ